MNSKKTAIGFVVSVLLMVGAVVVSACVGAVSIPSEAVLEVLKAKIFGTELPSEWEPYALTIWNLRFPRIALSLISGAALALCGAAFQCIFRNPICDPYILGISSGASLGAAFAIIVGLDSFLFGISGMALLSALLTLLLILAISSMGKRKSVETILLAGVAVNFLVSACITLLMVLHQESLDEIIFWTMGSFASATWGEISILFIVLVLVGIILFFNYKELNIIQLGTTTAKSTGVDTKRTTLTILLSSSLLVGSVVACSGVVGFVGLIIPHIVRLLFGNNARAVFTFSILLGAVFCLVADTLARTVAMPAELPVGSITALIGAPYFIFLLITKHRYSIS